MRVRVHTMSGSVYLLDQNNMTWERLNTKPGHEDILGFDHNNGKLAIWPTVAVGQPMYFTDKNPSNEADTTPITTTQVVRVELL